MAGRLGGHAPSACLTPTALSGAAGNGAKARGRRGGCGTALRASSGAVPPVVARQPNGLSVSQRRGRPLRSFTQCRFAVSGGKEGRPSCAAAVTWTRPSCTSVTPRTPFTPGGPQETRPLGGIERPQNLDGKSRPYSLYQRWFRHR